MFKPLISVCLEIFLKVVSKNVGMGSIIAVAILLAYLVSMPILGICIPFEDWILSLTANAVSSKTLNSGASMIGAALFSSSFWL